MAFIGNTPTTQAFTPAIDYFSGNGSTTAFTLSRPVASVAQVQVTIDNVAQNPSSAYTVSGSTITFTSAPLSGTNNIYVYYTSPITQVIAPGQGTVTTTSMASGLTLTSPTITGGAFNGTLGATTPSTVAATSITASTTLNVTGAATLTADATISGLTVGKGGGAGGTNTAIGQAALSGVNTNTYQVAVGHTALQNNTSGGQNTAVGGQTLVSNTTGSTNTAVGFQALYLNTASGNTAVGGYALNVNTSGGANIAIGQQALGNNTTASNNTVVGYQAALAQNTAGTTAIGYQAGIALTSGSDNVFVGLAAGQTTTTGSTNTCIGRDARTNAVGDSNEVVVGGGFPFTGKGSNTAYIGGSSGAYNQANNASWSTTSDRRLKKNIVDNTDGLNKITSVRVRNFEYRTEEEVTELPASAVIEKTGVQLGVIAQELQAVLPDCVKEESSGVLSVQSDNLTWYMVNAIQELKAINDTQAETINALTARIEALENR